MCETLEKQTLPLTQREKKYSLKESGQHAKVDTLFANTAHMETPRLTFANLTIGLQPRQRSVTLDHVLKLTYKLNVCLCNDQTLSQTTKEQTLKAETLLQPF